MLFLSVPRPTEGPIGHESRGRSIGVLLSARASLEFGKSACVWNANMPSPKVASACPRACLSAGLAGLVAGSRLCVHNPPGVCRWSRAATPSLIPKTISPRGWRRQQTCTDAWPNTRGKLLAHVWRSPDVSRGWSCAYTCVASAGKLAQPSVLSDISSRGCFGSLMRYVYIYIYIYIYRQTRT